MPSSCWLLTEKTNVKALWAVVLIPSWSSVSWPNFTKKIASFLWNLGDAADDDYEPRDSPRLMGRTRIPAATQSAVRRDTEVAAAVGRADARGCVDGELGVSCVGRLVSGLLLQPWQC